MATMMMHEHGKAEGHLRKGTRGRTCQCCATGWHRRPVKQAQKQRARRREGRQWRKEAADA